MIDLIFYAKDSGMASIEIAEALLNTDLVTQNSMAWVEILEEVAYGDVDENGAVQAYDAALVLQYSVDYWWQACLYQDNYYYQDTVYYGCGMPNAGPADPAWFLRANVDGNWGITSYDASLILQYTVGRINKFPVQDNYYYEDSFQYINYKSAQSNDVTLNIVNNEVVVRIKTDSITAVNIYVPKSEGCTFKEPTFTNLNASFANSKSSDGLSFGMAAAYPAKTGSIIATIPVEIYSKEVIDVYMVVNSKNSNNVKFKRY
ncbi:MAG: hypothetical protein HC896_18185 [Bacteroidales bacterium]|nr:hypothetical protein [Bacteroidales bacterium]